MSKVIFTRVATLSSFLARLLLKVRPESGRSLEMNTEQQGELEHS